MMTQAATATDSSPQLVGLAHLSLMWKHRNGGDLAAATEIFAKVCLDLSLNLGLSLPEQAASLQQKGLGPEAIVDLLLFRVSQHRHEHDLPRAMNEGLLIKQIAESMGLVQHFQLAMQIGLNLFAQASFSAALNEFHAAVSLARNDQERALSDLNRILCLEILGYRFDDKLESFVSFWESMPNKEQAWARDVHSQLLILRLEHSLRQAHIEMFASLANEAAISPHTAYFTLLVSQLPFLQIPLTKGPELMSLLLERPGAYQVQFRLRTLGLSYITSDFGVGHRMADKLERLYLWTWRWLAAPDARLLSKIMVWWQHLVEAVHAAQIAGSDFILLSNAVRWLALFAGIDDRIITARLGSLASSQNESSGLFDFEARFLDLCYALRDGDTTMVPDLFACLSRHGAAKAPGFSLPALADVIKSRLGMSAGEMDEPALPVWWNTIISLQDRLDGETLKPGIHVDIMAKRVLVLSLAGKCLEIDNEHLVLFLSLAATRQTIPIGDLVIQCFGAKSYYPHLHDFKVAHLLTAANRAAAPFMAFRRKRDTVMIEKKIPGSNIHVRAGEHARQMLLHRDAILRWPGPQVNREDLPPPAKLPAKIPLSAGIWIKRKELEERVALSRATVCRRIAQWLKSGLLDKRGAGRATEYRLQPELVFALQQSSEGK